MNPQLVGFVILAAPTYDSLDLYFEHDGKVEAHSVLMATPVSQRRTHGGYPRVIIPSDASGSPYLWLRVVGNDDGKLQILSQADADSDRFIRNVGRLLGF